jgi:hypothetical protein
MDYNKCCDNCRWCLNAGTPVVEPCSFWDECLSHSLAHFEPTTWCILKTRLKNFLKGLIK